MARKRLVSVRLDEDEWDQIKAKAEETNRSASDVLRMALKRGLNPVPVATVIAQPMTYAPGAATCNITYTMVG